MAFSGLLPLRVFGITFTPAMNTVQIIVAATISLFLVYYAWFRDSIPENSK